MKKISLAIAAFSFFLSSTANSATSGNYLSADAILLNAKFYEDYTQNQTSQRVRPSSSESGGGAGVTYKYAANLGGAFISPGIFFEQNNLKIETKNNPVYKQQINIKNRYGARIDLGFDVVDHFAIYAIGGYAMVNYSAENFTASGTSTLTTRKNSGSAGGAIYGLGIKTEIVPEVAVSIEYTTQNISATTKIPNDYLGYRGKYKTRIDAAKLSIAYHF